MTSSIKSVRMLGLAGLLAAVAMAIVASIGAASASAALPEFSKVCYQPGGSSWRFLSEPECNSGSPEVANGTWERIKFTSTSGISELETKAGHKVKCTADASTGELTGAKAVGKVVVKFTGCEEPTLKVECKTKGAAAKEIITNELKGKIAYIKGTHGTTKEVGLALEPSSTTGERLFAEFECPAGIFGTEVIKVGHAGGAGGDSIVCPIVKTNEVTTSFTLTCSQTKGVQSPIEYEEEVGGAWTKVTDYLESEGKGPSTFGWEQSGEKTTDTITTTASGEIKA